MIKSEINFPKGSNNQETLQMVVSTKLAITIIVQL